MRYYNFILILLLSCTAYGSPAWLNNPDIPGYMGAVGIAKPQKGGKSIQKRVAITLARAELAERINVHIASEVSISQECLQDACQKNVSQMVQQRSSELLKLSVVKEVFFDEETDEMYVWVILPIKE